MRSAAIALLLFATVCLAEPGAEQIQKRGGIVHRPLPFVGNGTCEEPVSNGDLTTVRCLGPAIPLLPGQTIDCNFLLESPYPSDRNVTVLRQEAQIVSRTGENSWREVPLTEVYVHHVVPNPRFLLGEGAEIRGSRLRKALPSPLAFVVDGEEASKHETRMTNLQLVNTIGVPKDRLQSSFECWCGHPELGENSTRGSLFCCKQNPTTSAAGIEHYQLEYNITFRDATRDEKRMHFFGFDATDNKLEYNIAEPTGPNTTHTAAIEVAIDKTCPQSKPFQIVRCTAHQHIGSRCMNVYNLDKGHELICSSCPIYGTDGNSPGNEEGYVVAIQDDDPFYTIEPGTRIRVESVYDGAQKRLGVMGIIGLWVSGLTKECDRFKAEGPMSMMANAVHSTVVT